MSKIVIFGAAGTLGHILLHDFIINGYNALPVVRIGDSKLNMWATNKKINFDYYELDLKDKFKIIKFMNKIKPDIVINCAAILDQMNHDIDYINSKFPKIISELLPPSRRLIHISSDAVYLDNQFPSEDGKTNPNCLYSKSKLSGEVHSENTLNIRTSIIGPSLNGKGFYNNLLDANIPYKAYTNHIFSGLTTLELSKIIRFIIKKNMLKNGIFNIGGSAISKYELALIINKYKCINKNFAGKSKIAINRAFNSSKFASFTGYRIPDWNSMIKALCTYDK